MDVFILQFSDQVTFEHNLHNIPFVFCDYATADGAASMPLVRKLIGNLIKAIIILS